MLASCGSLTVEDNGKGFDPAKTSSGFGLKGMQERVAVVNGQFRLKTSPGKGCRIEVQIHSLERTKNVLPKVKSDKLEIR